LWLVVGLGNPGREYKNTRHNAGFMALERAAASWGARFGRLPGRARARTATAERRGEEILLALPQTFMNRSGFAVRSLMGRKGVLPERLVVITDDLDIDLGEIRVRKGGSPGTHNGMRSVVQEIGYRDFPRIRIGIGPLPAGEDATDFVLNDFAKEEKPLLEKAMEEAEEALDLVLAGETEKAMSLFNRKTKPLSIS
jgi:PTH1 family peptidyl-tRNA hydrolase